MTGWTPIDPILSVLLSALVLRSAWSLLKNSLQILMEGTPSGLDVEAMRDGLVTAVPGLADVSHIHVWSITSGRATATMHAVLDPGADPGRTVRALKAHLAAAYGIAHSTIEIDWGGGPRDCSMASTVASDDFGHDRNDGGIPAPAGGPAR
jgi:cobalt-zinc-cadmium efflux system protein